MANTQVPVPTLSVYCCWQGIKIIVIFLKLEDKYFNIRPTLESGSSGLYRKRIPRTAYWIFTDMYPQSAYYVWTRCSAAGEHIGFCRDQNCKLFLNSRSTQAPSPEDVSTIWQSEHSACVLSLQAKLQGYPILDSWQLSDSPSLSLSLPSVWQSSSLILTLIILLRHL